MEANAPTRREELPKNPRQGDLVNAIGGLSGDRNYSHTGVAVYVDETAGKLKVMNFSGVHECNLHGVHVYEEDDYTLPGTTRNMRDQVRAMLRKK